MSAIANIPTPRSLSTLTQRVQEVIQPNPVPALRTIDLNELRGLSGVTKFFILLAAPSGESWSDLCQTPESDSPPASSASFNLPEAFKRTATQSSDSDVMIGEVKVNFATMEAHRRGEALFLTALEFRTLKHLIANARRVISRDELLNEVWGYQNYPSTRTVDNQVAKLRKKLEDDPARPVHLRTVRGVGYKFLP